MIEGQLSDEGLAAMSECEDMTAQLAKDLMNGIKENVEDITASFKQMAIKNERNTEKTAAKTNAPTELKVVKPAVTADNGQTDGQLSLFDLLAS